jgi:hypothetical protein
VRLSWVIGEDGGRPATSRPASGAAGAIGGQWGAVLWRICAIGVEFVHLGAGVLDAPCGPTRKRDSVGKSESKQGTARNGGKNDVCVSIYI